jgi:hypothetical protein
LEADTIHCTPKWETRERELSTVKVSNPWWLDDALHVSIDAERGATRSNKGDNRRCAETQQSSGQSDVRAEFQHGVGDDGNGTEP